MELRDAVKEFIRLLDIIEESDSGRVFKPNKIQSCRVYDSLKMEEYLKVMKRETTGN